MRRQDLYCDSGHDIGLFLSQKNVSKKGEMNMLTLLFSVWLLYVIGICTVVKELFGKTM